MWVAYGYEGKVDPVNWSSDLPVSPVLQLPMFHGRPEPITVFMVPVRKWSDGTAVVMEHKGA